MLFDITANGIKGRTIEDLKGLIEDSFREIYGSNINLNPETPDGQLVAILAKYILDVQNLAINVRSELNINTATGVVLDRICKLVGITRKDGIPSTLNVKLYGSHNQLIKAKTQFIRNGVKWELVQDATLNAQGVTNSLLRSIDNGAFLVSSGQELEPIDDLKGVRVEAINDSKLGSQQEHDHELKARYYRSLNINALSSSERLTNKILSLEGVKSLYMSETRNGINIIVHGGLDNQILEVIRDYKPLGLILNGRIEKDYEIITDNYKLSINSAFSRPTVTPIYVTVYVTSFNHSLVDNHSYIDDEELKELFNNLNYSIGQTVNTAQLTGLVQHKLGNRGYVTRMIISKDDNAESNRNHSYQKKDGETVLETIYIDDDEVAIFSSDRVVVHRE